MINLIGRFYFKLTDNKNLVGEFSNNFSKRNCTESADRMPSQPDETGSVDEGKFVGEYFTTWHEEQECVLAKLKIVPKKGCENIFTLTWWPVNKGKEASDPFYWGEGLLCDGILIGDYRNFETISTPMKC